MKNVDVIWPFKNFKGKVLNLFFLSFLLYFKAFANDSFTIMVHSREVNNTNKVTFPYKQTVSVYSAKLVYEGPNFGKNYNFTISEEAEPGTVIGAVTAVDPPKDILTYSFKSGNTNGAFRMDSATGQILIAKTLNHHTQNQYTLIVKAVNPKGSEAETTVTISVTPEIKNTSSNSLQWETVASQPYPISEAQGKVVQGKLYTFGGFDSQKPGFTPTSRAYVYNLLTNSWTALAPMPPMNNTRYGGVTHAGITTDGTDIYFAGGYTADASGNGQIFGTREVWKFIIAENRYVRLPDLPVVVAAGQLEYLHGKLHYIGGTNQTRTQDLNSHFALDLDNLQGGWKTLAPLPIPRQHAGSAVFEGKIYYIGGQTGHDRKLQTQKYVHQYDPVTNTWVKLANIPVPSGASGRGHISSSVIVAGNQIIVLGGETAHSTGRTDMVSAYTPATNSWVNLTALPQTRFSGVAGLLGNHIVYTGGSRTTTTFKSSAVIILPPLPLTNLQTNTTREYRFGKLRQGTTIYTDQPDHLTKLPGYLNEAIFVKAPDADKSQTKENVFSFKLTQGGTLYVAYDMRASTLPAWLSTWEKVPDTLQVKSTETAYLQLYRKNFEAGEIAFNGNMAPPAAGAVANYIVILAPVPTASNQENLNNASGLKVYPNPAQPGTTLQVAIEGIISLSPVSFTIYDITGRVISSILLHLNQSGETTIQLSQAFPAGVYLLKLQGSFGEKQRKLLIE